MALRTNYKPGEKISAETINETIETAIAAKTIAEAAASGGTAAYINSQFRPRVDFDSNPQEQITAKAPKDNPVFTGTAEAPKLQGRNGVYDFNGVTAQEIIADGYTAQDIESEFRVYSPQKKPALTDIGAQARLVSGVNIKTVGGTSLLGSGNIVLPVGKFEAAATSYSIMFNGAWLVTLTGGTGFKATVYDTQDAANQILSNATMAVISIDAKRIVRVSALITSTPYSTYNTYTAVGNISKVLLSSSSPMMITEISKGIALPTGGSGGGGGNQPVPLT